MANASFDAVQSRNSTLMSNVLEHPGDYRILTGERPTGRLHVGHYFGTLQNRVRLQAAGVDTFLVVADYQVLTDRDATESIRDNVFGFLADYIAVGIDPGQTTIFAHSYIASLNQLLLPFLALTTVAELERNPTVKEEIRSAQRGHVSAMMFTYPAHQAADILFCKGNLVPGGKDQLPHIELARTVARRFNERYAGGETYFREPELLLSDAPLLLGVDGRKMGKSLNNAIAIGASEAETTALLRKAKTDSIPEIYYDPEDRPEIANLLLLGALCLDETPEEFASRIGTGSGRLKSELADVVNERFRAIRARRAEVADDRAYLGTLLREGNEKAKDIGDRTLSEVRSLMQMTYY